MNGGNMSEREQRQRAVKILAKSIYKDLQEQGFDEKQIIGFATELISQVATDIAKTGDNASPHAAA